MPSENGLIEEGKYYVVRVRSYSGIGSLNYYYMIKVTNNGVGEMKWLCFTENESIRDDEELFEENTLIGDGVDN